MGEGESPHNYGVARITPTSAVVAGQYGTWQVNYTVGDQGVYPGGRIFIETDTDTDWEQPQVHDSSADDYLTVDVPDGAGVIARAISNTKQQFTITKRALTEGETITVTFGDRRDGGRGSRAQTFAESRHYLHVWLDIRGDGHWIRLPDSPELSIVGGEAARLVLQATSTVTVNEEFSILIRAEDEWGNAATLYRGVINLAADGISIPRDRVTFDQDTGGIVRIDGCVAAESGTHRIRVDDANGLSAVSNPVEAHDTPPEFKLYWGDLHGGQVADSGKIEAFYRFGRDIAGIDFVGYQRNDHSMSADDYRVQQRLERAFYAPGSFVPVPGYEWSANTAFGGHHNVFFRRFDQPARRSSHRDLEDKSDQHLDLPHITDVYDAYRGSDAVITPHVGGEHSDLTYHDTTLEPALEVTSDHGSFAWFLEQALTSGYRVGFLGGSDSHNGRPGNDHPGHQLRRYAKSGLTGLYTKELTLDGVIEAVQARRCYATTGARIIASVTADGHFLGSEYRTSRNPTIVVSIEGTAPFEEVFLFRGIDEVYRHDLVYERSAHSVRISWEGASKESSYSGLIWDGEVRIVEGALNGVKSFRFDSPRSYISIADAHGFHWHSWTCGYRSGVIAELDSDAEMEVVVSVTNLARIAFGGRGRFDQRLAYSPQDQVRLTVRPSDLLDGPQQVDLGELDRKITLELEPQSDSRSASFTFTDDSPIPGINPYWIRAHQQDGEILWTSPVFADYVSDALSSPTDPE